MMKTIGLIGGMSWESTVTYYQIINRGVKQQLGGHHSAKLVLVSVDFAEIEEKQHQGDWQATADILIVAARQLEAAGAEAMMICTNTMHKVADDVCASVDLPLLHIADCTAEVLKQQGVETVGLLGTAFTMEQPFYSQRLEQAGIQVLVPDPDGRREMHRIIYEELCQGQILANSRAHTVSMIADLAEQGASAVILGCTEIGLLVSQRDTPVALLDTTRIHAEAAVRFMLEGG